MMDRRQLGDVLDECLTLIAEDQATVPACLARYPEHAAELRPLLELSVEIRRAPRPRPRRAAFTKGKERMLKALGDGKQQENRNPSSLFARCKEWVVARFAREENPAGGGRLAWSGALATAVVLLVVAVSGALMLPSWLGARVARSARLDTLQGRVEVRTIESEAWMPVPSFRRLEAGDRVRTADRGEAMLTFFDGSTTALEQGTELMLVELESRRDGTARSIVLHQRSGQTHHEVRPLRRTAARFQVRTPTAVTAVRGTTFDVVVEADGATQVAVLTGLVTFTSGETTVELQPGWARTALPDGSISEPIVVPTPRKSERFARFPTLDATSVATTTEVGPPTARPTTVPTGGTPLPPDTPRATEVAGSSDDVNSGVSKEPSTTPVLPTVTPTRTPVPPTATPTNTPLPPTATPTSGPPSPPPTDPPPSPPETELLTATPTNTPVLPTATPTPETVEPTATPTNTSVPPTATPTSGPPSPPPPPTDPPPPETELSTATPTP